MDTPDSLNEFLARNTLVQVAVGAGQGSPRYVLDGGVGSEDEDARGATQSLYLPTNLYAGFLAEPEI